MAKILYRGFSSSAKNFSITDMDCVNADIVNHINTIKGERAMLPDFGTRIPLLAFEPLDERTLDIVREDLKTVIAYDPRVSLIDMAVMALPDNNAIIAVVDLQYLELNVTGTLRLEFPVGS